MRSYLLSKISTITDPAHISDVRITFHSSNKPIVYSWIIHFQVEQTNNIIALTVFFLFILNISVEQTKFHYNGGSISNRSLTITLSTFMTVNNVKPFTQALTRLRTSTEFEKVYVHQFTSLRRYIWHFLSKIKYCNVVSEGILKLLPLFYDIQNIK